MPSHFTVSSLLWVFLVLSEAVYMLPWYYTPDAWQESTNICQGKEEQSAAEQWRWISLYAFAQPARRPTPAVGGRGGDSSPEVQERRATSPRPSPPSGARVPEAVNGQALLVSSVLCPRSAGRHSQKPRRVAGRTVGPF